MQVALAFLVFFISPVLFAKKDLTQNNPKTINVMHSVFAPMSELLPLSLDSKEFSSPKNKDFILKKMQEVVDGSSALTLHAQTGNKGFTFLASRLQVDARDMLAWYKKNRSDEARTILHNMTENCIACHSQWTSDPTRAPNLNFFEKADLAKLAPVQRAQMFVASRKFDDALTQFETFFNSKDLTPAQVAQSDAFTTYLKVSLRVKKDTARPKATLTKWLKKPKIPAVMRGEIEAWIASLDQIEKEKALTSTDPFATGKKLISMGQQPPDLSLDRSKLVYFIAGSGRLLESISKEDLKQEDKAEAYYLLGVCESAMGASYWITLSDSYFEAAIRALPESALAQKAFEALKAELSYEEAPSAGTAVNSETDSVLNPENLSHRLDELRLIAFGKAAAKKN